MGSRGVLTKRQRQILVGTLLGDGHLELNGRYSRLRIDHQEKQKEYIFWKASEFLPFSLSPREVVFGDKRYKKIYKRWHLSTKSLPIFNKYQKMFYRNRVKIIPENIVELVDNLSLAIWYMDDGFRRRDCKGFYLCTSSFTENEQRALQKMLLAKFGLTTKLHHQRKLLRIFIPSASSDRFQNIVAPFILPIFKYKLF